MDFSQQLPIVIHSLNIGFLQTLRLFVITLIGACPLGLAICFGSMSRIKPVSAFFKLLIWVVRGTPLMIQLLIIYFFPGLVLHNPIWGGGETGRFLAASVSFILNYACYFSEIYRGGIQSVPVGQEEAGLVLGMTKSQIFFRVKLLQMVKRILPPMSNEILTLVKDTSLARIIALQEIIWAGQAFMKGSQGISGQIWPLFFTAIYYLIFNGILTVVLGKLEKKLDYFIKGETDHENFRSRTFMQILWTDKGAERYQLFSGRKPGAFHHWFFRKWKNHASALPEFPGTAGQWYDPRQGQNCL